MSGIYIPGMEMPKSCGQCPLHKPLYHTQYCTIMNKNCAPHETIKEWCPLVPVPLHGRLIDADELCTRLLSAWDTVNREKKMMISAVMADVVTPIVVGTSTIIPAEEEES